MLQRLDKLRESMEDGTAAFISGYPNIFYYSGFTSEDAWLVISHDRQALITDSRYTIQAKEQSPEFEIADIKNGWETLLKGFGEKRIIYEEDMISAGELRRIREKAPDKEFCEGQKKINLPRRIKDKNEIKLIAEAERIGDEAFSYILDRIKVGVTEREIALELEFFMKKCGASALSFETIAASGKRSAMPHGTASSKKIENGDFLTLDFGCVFNGYCSDMTRTVVVGRADDRQKEIYNTVLKAQTAALDALKSGKRCSDIDALSRGIIADAGYGKNFGHGLGHSVGIEIHEAPTLSPKCNDLLEEGHIITVEPGIYIEDFGGVRIEDLAVITADGIENLTHSPKELTEL